MDKIKKVIFPFTLLLIIIILLLLMTYKKNYPTLKEAVRATSRGGVILEKYKISKGYYVIIDDSNVLTNGFYYKENKKWYYESDTIKHNYNIEEGKTVSIYYYPNQDISIIELIQEKPEIIKVSDTENTEFKERRNKKENYIGILNKKVGDEYKILVNDKMFTLE